MELLKAIGKTILSVIAGTCIIGLVIAFITFGWVLLAAGALGFLLLIMVTGIRDMLQSKQ